LSGPEAFTWLAGFVAGRLDTAKRNPSYVEPSPFPTVELPRGTFRAKKRCPLKDLGERKVL
jgi:hypothetical protein